MPVDTSASVFRNRGNAAPSWPSDNKKTLDTVFTNFLYLKVFKARFMPSMMFVPPPTNILLMRPAKCGLFVIVTVFNGQSLSAVVLKVIRQSLSYSFRSCKR